MADHRDDLVQLVGDDSGAEPISGPGGAPDAGGIGWWLFLDVLERFLGLAALTAVVVAACVGDLGAA